MLCESDLEESSDHETTPSKGSKHAKAPSPRGVAPTSQTNETPFAPLRLDRTRHVTFASGSVSVSDPEVVSAQRASKAARDIANGMVACVLATAIAWVLRQSKTKMLRVELARRMEVLESVAAACLAQSILLATQQLASIGDVDNDDDGGDANDDGDDDGHDGHGHDDHDQDEADDTDHEHDDDNDDNDDDRDCDASEDQGTASRTARKSAEANRLREELDGMYACLEEDHAPVVTSSAI